MERQLYVSMQLVSMYVYVPTILAILTLLHCVTTMTRNSLSYGKITLHNSEGNQEVLDAKC